MNKFNFSINIALRHKSHSLLYPRYFAHQYSYWGSLTAMEIIPSVQQEAWSTGWYRASGHWANILAHPGLWKLWLLSWAKLSLQQQHAPRIVTWWSATLPAYTQLHFIFLFSTTPANPGWGITWKPQPTSTLNPPKKQKNKKNYLPPTEPVLVWIQHVHVLMACHEQVGKTLTITFTVV